VLCSALLDGIYEDGERGRRPNEAVQDEQPSQRREEGDGEDDLHRPRQCSSGVERQQRGTGSAFSEAAAARAGSGAGAGPRSARCSGGDGKSSRVESVIIILRVPESGCSEVTELAVSRKGTWLCAGQSPLERRCSLHPAAGPATLSLSLSRPRSGAERPHFSAFDLLDWTLPASSPCKPVHASQFTLTPSVGLLSQLCLFGSGFQLIVDSSAAVPELSYMPWPLKIQDPARNSSSPSPASETPFPHRIRIHRPLRTDDLHARCQAKSRQLANITLRRSLARW